MDKETAKIALQFMNRVQLSGQEVGAFMQVVTALQAEANKEEDASSENRDSAGS